MKDIEEFSREDPERKHTYLWLPIFRWVVPVVIICVGLFNATQNFARLVDYNESVVGKPLFLRPDRTGIYNPLVFLLGIIKFSFDEVYSALVMQVMPTVFISLGLAVIVFVVCSILLSAHQHNQHIHGTARWATKKDLKKNGLLQQYGVVCGELDTANVGFHVDAEKASLVLDLPKNLVTQRPHVDKLVCHSGRTNTWMIAPTRSGKGVSTVIPTCLNYGVPYWDWEYNKKSIFYKKKITRKLARTSRIIKGKGSMVIFDPKGENWAATAGYRSKFSTCIPFRPLDPDGNTCHYNPIHEIPDTASEAFAWADMIGEIFFGAENAKAASDGASQYFNNMARDIFSGVVLHVRFSKKIPWEEKNISMVLTIFSQAKNEDDAEDEEGGCGSVMLAQLREDGVHVDDDGKENQFIHDLIVKAANRSEIQNPKERSSTYATVFSKISLFQDPLIAQATRYSDFSVDDFVNSKNGISLYLIVPYNHIKRISPVFRLLITFMIKKFSSGTTNANDVKLKNPCLFLLDEFPVLGYFPDIAQNAGILAGYGVTFFIVSQSLNQIVDVYGENHPFLDHCKTIIMYAPGNLKDARQFSETIGNRSVLLDNISSSGNQYQIGMNSVSRSSQETSTSLVSPDELMKLKFNRAIIMNQNMPPYKGKKVVYYEDPRFKDKAFLDEPTMKEIESRVKKLPSHHHRKIRAIVEIDEQIAKIENIEAINVVENIDVFQELKK